MTNKKTAFTLIETIITIVIITIVISGVIFAKNMIKENQIKSLIAQIAKYDTAVDSFAAKYHALPGDIYDTATYNITEIQTSGNGDNIVTDNFGSNIAANGEIARFWLHLSKTKMLDEIYDGKEDKEATLGGTFPVSKLGDKVGIVAFGADGKNFYQIGFDFADTDRIYMKDRSLKTDEALLFDQKVDDGLPEKGRIIAVGGLALNIPQNSECVKFGEYNQSNVSPACQLRIEIKKPKTIESEF